MTFIYWQFIVRLEMYNTSVMKYKLEMLC